YCRASLAEHMDAERLFTETKQGFDFYHANFGFAYPFGKYDQIFVPEFNAGAMENAGCVTIRDEYVFSSQATHYMYERRADTILHELAHMWFGDLVTMKWWDDLWLNESFATWAAAISQAESTEYDTAWVTFANVEKSWAYQQDQLPTTHPISTDASDIETVEQNFDGITYAKGASVLKQLQAYVGRENFFAGVRRHFSKHAWGNATFNDLLGHLEDASGRDLSFWAAEWLKTTGVNTLSAETEQEGGKYTSFAVQQSGDTLRTHRIAVGLYRLEDGKVSRFKQVEVDISGERTEIPELAGAEVAELVLLNDDDLTYTLLEFDPETVEFVVNNIDKIADPMARTLCWSTAWEMTRAGTMRARDFAQLVARGLSAETELAVLERICNQAITAVDTYADPQWAQAEGFALLADAFLAEASAADDNGAGNRSIVFKQALTKIDLNEAARDYLVELRASSDDKALRWKALAALVANGAIDDVEALVAQELEADNTASGYQASLRALAAFNSDENKRAVWDEIMSLQLSNLELRHKLEGLTMSGSEKHLIFAPDEYFANAQKVWDAGSSEIALGTIQGLYPSWNVSQETIDATDKFLENELPSGLRRAVTEERDRLARALRNRAIDAQ
ncbi:MAG: aminopeptidase N, partial [Corynebacterium casei]|nr:aminopeptidase N [Corynebacterium casei]